MMDANPLIAPRQDSTQWSSGIWIVEDVSTVVDGVNSGSWVEGSIGGLAVSMDALAVVTDPLGALVSMGVAWLIEHCKPLSDALDWLAGDPDQIEAYAGTWHNVAEAVRRSQAELLAAQAKVDSWSGVAADAFRQRGHGESDAMRGIAAAADGIGQIVEVAGLLVALVREMVRDLIAEFVSVLAVRVWEWAAEEGLTFGLATPAVVAQVSALVGRWAAKIERLLHDLVSSLRRLSVSMDQLNDLMRSVKESLHRLTRRSGDSTVDPEDLTRVHGGHTSRPRNQFDFERQEQWATDAYGHFRANDDADAIAANLGDVNRPDGSTGFTSSEIEQIRQHVFFEEHPLLDYDGDIVHRRYDASSDMAEAWIRLRDGRQRPEDVALLEHELAESRYYRDHPGATYQDAHAAANNVSNWQDQIPEPTYEDYSN